MADTKQQRLQKLAEGSGVFGYDHHMRLHALRMANGVAVILLGFAIGHFLMLLPQHNSADIDEIIKGLDRAIGIMTKELVDLPENQRHPESFIVEVLGVIVGCIILRHTQRQDDDYVATFHRIEQFYTPAQRRRYRVRGWLSALAGALVIAIAHLLLAVFAVNCPSALVQALSMLSVAVGVWLLIHGFDMAGRTNLFSYNFRALRHVNIYELGLNQDADERERLIGEKRLSSIYSSIKTFAVILAVLAAFALYYLPTLHTVYFWVPIAAVYIIAAICEVFVMRAARRKYEPDFD